MLSAPRPSPWTHWCARVWSAAAGTSRAVSWPSLRRGRDGCCQPRSLPAGQRAMTRPEPPHLGVRPISSLQNERVKLIRSLEMRKARRDSGLFVAEGISVLATARAAGWSPHLLVFLAGSAGRGLASELLAWAGAAGAECLEVSPAVLAKVAAKDNPQTMLGVFAQRWVDAPPPAGVSEEAVWVALEAVRDPGNLGTIMRTAD